MDIRWAYMVSKLDLYRIFHTVSRHESFSKAAKELYMTQPAVSQSIANLEKDLKTYLFTRTSKGVQLTNEGQLLHEYVTSALSLLETAELKMDEFQNLMTGELRIGVGDTIARYYLLTYLEKFHMRYPGIKLTIKNGTTHEIVTALKAGEVDVGICNLPIEDPQLHVLPCGEIQDIFVCGDKYKNLTMQPIALRTLLRMPLIFLEKGSNSRQYVEEYLQKQGYELAPEFDLGSHDLLLEFARINLGIACVTKEFAKDYLSRGILYEITLDEQIPPRSLGICTFKNIPMSRATKKFIKIIDARFA